MLKTLSPLHLYPASALVSRSAHFTSSIERIMTADLHSEWKKMECSEDLNNTLSRILLSFIQLAKKNYTFLVTEQDGKVTWRFVDIFSKTFRLQDYRIRLGEHRCWIRGWALCPLGIAVPISEKHIWLDEIRYSTCLECREKSEKRRNANSGFINFLDEFQVEVEFGHNSFLDTSSL